MFLKVARLTKATMKKNMGEKGQKIIEQTTEEDMSNIYSAYQS